MIMLTDAMRFIFEKKEIGSEKINDFSYYNNFLNRPTYPGGASGVTIGIGYDCGYNTAAQIRKDWEGKVNGNILSYLISVAGLKGALAKKRITSAQRGFIIPIEAARQVFEEVSYPKFKALTLSIYPKVVELNEITQAVIIGLVYNRGASFGERGKPSWDRRKEMRELGPAIEAKDYKKIANLIDSMKRLWLGESVGLVKRREWEAQTILNSI
jgi:hypothetical protein